MGPCVLHKQKDTNADTVAYTRLTRAISINMWISHQPCIIRTRKITNTCTHTQGRGVELNFGQVHGILIRVDILNVHADVSMLA